jgi:hypothetical protein
MKIIKNKHQFMKMKSINEVVENETKWGDSLIGRLINSTIRKMKISRNLSKIGDLLKLMEVELERLSELIKVSEESDSVVEEIQFKSMFSEHLKEIRQSIEDEMNVEEIIKLVKIKIKTVESYIIKSEEVLKLKSEFISLLNRFLEFLENIQSERKIGPYFLFNNEEKIGFLLSRTTRDDKKGLVYSFTIKEDQISGERLNISNYANWRNTAAQFNTNNAKRSLRTNGQFINKDDLKGTIFEGFNIPLHKEDKNYDIEFHEQIKIKLEEEFSKLKEEFESNNFDTKVKKEKIEEVIKRDLVTESRILKYKKFILERNNNNSNILNEFENIFRDFADIIVIRETDDKVVKESESKNIPLDPVIEIIRLFNRSYRIHTPGVIPSGRTGGEVSNSVFREYEDLGGGSGSPDKPGSGPYRNIKLFDKWRDGVLSLISQSRFQTIFNEDTSFKIGESDIRKNIQRKKQGGGKTLLTFINSMLDSSDGYKKGAQSKFIAEYFNVKLDDKDLNSIGYNDTDKNNKIVDKIVDKFKFKQSEESFKEDQIIRVLKEDEKDRYYYIRVIKVDKQKGETMLLISLGNPFDIPIEVDDIKDENNLIFARTKKDKIDSSFELESYFITSEGKKGEKHDPTISNIGIDKSRGGGPEILFKGKKISTQNFPIKSTDHKKVWDLFSQNYKGDLYSFFE